ncbi:MAG: peptide ABC transporter substrate-binding protein [Anaerolineae bacterium]|nr:peptide ABC transporter substrate-binding protein [Anaerolineae bacterium]
MRRKQWCIAAALIGGLLVLGNCAPRVVTVEVTLPPETVVVTATPPLSPLPDPTPQPKTLTVCVLGEPDTLYLYGGSWMHATQHVMEALYDGPVDYLNYTYRPVILQKIPTLADGDALTRTIRVGRGSRVVDINGNPVALEEGVTVLPSGCRSEECAVKFTGEPLRMDRMEVTFALKEGLTWADGAPLTAEDSAFAYKVASDPVTPGRRYLAERTAHYIAIDEQRVRWTGLPGFMPPTYFLNFFPPLPRHQLEKYTPKELLTADETRRYPLGWGPFYVKEWVWGDHITLERNHHYFRASEGLPLLDQVVFKFASNTPDLIARLLAGECDLGTHDADLEPSLPLLMEAQQQGLLQVVFSISNGWEHLDFGIVPSEDYARPDFFGDVRVRQAIAQCIDRQAIVNEVTYGSSVVPDSYLPPGHPLYGGTYLLHWGYNPEGGQALLEEVGWMDTDGDGVREARRVKGVPPGTPFEVSLLVAAESASSQQSARMIKAHLADCGIRVNVELRPAWELYADAPEGPLFGRRFDLAETTWWFDVNPLCGHYTSSEIPGDGKAYGENITGYSNPDYDAICRKALLALPGTADYEKYHKQAQIIFSEELPAIPLFMRLRVAIARPNVLNFALDPTASSELWNIEAMDVR